MLHGELEQQEWSGRPDPSVSSQTEKIAYYSIYHQSTKTYQTGQLIFESEDRVENKQKILNAILVALLNILKEIEKE